MATTSSRLPNARRTLSGPLKRHLVTAGSATFAMLSRLPAEYVAEPLRPPSATTNSGAVVPSGLAQSGQEHSRAQSSRSSTAGAAPLASTMFDQATRLALRAGGQRARPDAPRRKSKDMLGTVAPRRNRPVEARRRPYQRVITRPRPKSFRGPAVGNAYPRASQRQQWVPTRAAYMSGIGMISTISIHPPASICKWGWALPKSFAAASWDCTWTMG